MKWKMNRRESKRKGEIKKKTKARRRTLQIKTRVSD